MGPFSFKPPEIHYKHKHISDFKVHAYNTSTWGRLRKKDLGKVEGWLELHCEFDIGLGYYVRLSLQINTMLWFGTIYSKIVTVIIFVEKRTSWFTQFRVYRIHDTSWLPQTPFFTYFTRVRKRNNTSTDRINQEELPFWKRNLHLWGNEML